MPSLVQRQRPATIAAVLAFAAVALYARTVAFPFVYFDDDLYIFQNEVVSSGVTPAGVVWAFTTGQVANWHPLTWLSHMIDVQCFGMWAGGHHAVNVFIHGANTALLFLALRTLTGATARSACVALLFAVHPVNVESVAWVAERKNLLSTFFLLMAIIAYARYVERPKVIQYLVVVGVFALGLMAKPMLVTLPFLLLLLDYWPLNRYAGYSPMNAVRRLGWLLWEKTPLFALTIASSAITYAVQQRGAAMEAMPSLSIEARSANAVLAYVSYLGHLIWPWRLAVIYPHPGEAYSAGMSLLALSFLLAVTAVALVLIRRAPYAFVGWFWFLGSLVPVIGLVQIGYQSMADRYLYVPAIGIFVGAVWGIAIVGERLRVGGGALTGFFPFVIAVLSVACCFQISYWRGTVPLFERAIAVTGTNAEAHNHLAYYYLSQNEPEKAIPHCEAAQRDLPSLAATYTNWGAALRMLGDTRGAIIKYVDALHRNPSDSAARTNVGIALLQMGYGEDARVQLEEAVRLAPQSATAHAYLGAAFAEQGRVDDAERHLRRALELDPGFDLAREGLDALNRKP